MHFGRDLLKRVGLHFDDHDAEIAASNDWHAIWAEQRRHRSMAFCPSFATENYLGKANRSLRLSGKSTGDRVDLADEGGPMRDKFSIFMSEEIFAPTPTASLPGFLVVLGIEHDLNRTCHRLALLVVLECLAELATDSGFVLASDLSNISHREAEHRIIAHCTEQGGRLFE